MTIESQPKAVRTVPANVRLLICDIDGTLVRRDKSAAPATIEAAKSLTASGIGMSLISARPISGVAAVAEVLGLDGPFGAFNGGTIYGPAGVIGEPARIDADVALAILATLDEAGVDAWIFADGNWYARTSDNPHVAREKLSAAIDPVIRDDLHALTNRADKIVGVSDEVALLKRVENAMAVKFSHRATIALSQPYFLDVTALAANKGDGVTAIAAAMGVPLSEVAVIGDMPNDLPMFARAGLSIAMGQAPHYVRAAADWVTDSNEDDGAARAIERLVYTC